MSARRVTPWVVIALVLAGAGTLAWRAHHRSSAQADRGDTFWRLRYEVTGVADKSGSRVRLACPLNTRHARLVHRAVRGPGLTLKRLKSKEPEEARELAAVAQQPGPIRLTADFDLHLTRRATWRPNTPDSEGANTVYLRAEDSIQTGSMAVARTLEQLLEDQPSRTQFVQRALDYCTVHVGAGDERAARDAAGAIESGRAAPLGRARAMVALCRAGGIPARVVTGFEVKRGAAIRPKTWVEVRPGARWEPFDLESGLARPTPAGLLPVRYGNPGVVRATGVANLKYRFSLVRMPPPEGATRAPGDQLADILDLTRLPVEMHQVLAVILLMPLGALATSILRTMVGMRTFGTFTPALLALSFVYANWQTGLMIFAAVLAVGLSSRLFLERLRLLMVPRLSVMLTLVVLTMVLGISALDYCGWTPGIEAVLLPMVIMTMTIERFYVNSEQDGVRSAVRLLTGTLFMAGLCYVLLRWERVGLLLLAHPEIHLFTIAALVLVGRYTGYRLSELWRFRDAVGGDA